MTKEQLWVQLDRHGKVPGGLWDIRVPALGPMGNLPSLLCPCRTGFTFTLIDKSKIHGVKDGIIIDKHGKHCVYHPFVGGGFVKWLIPTNPSGLKRRSNQDQDYVDDRKAEWEGRTLKTGDRTK